MLTPDEANAALREASRLRALGRRTVQGQTTRLPLIWWGLSWVVTYPAAQFLPVALAAAVGIVAAVAAFALTKLGGRWDPAPGRSGWERQVGHAWWAVLVAAFGVDLMVAPAPMQVYFLIPGGVWGLALLLYAIATRDVALGVLGAATMVLAAALRLVLLDDSLVLFGLLAGGAMAGTGLLRVMGTAGGR